MNRFDKGMLFVLIAVCLLLWAILVSPVHAATIDLRAYPGATAQCEVDGMRFEIKLPGDDVGEIKPPLVAPPPIKELTGFRTGISDHPSYTGQTWFLPASWMKTKIKSVMIGSEWAVKTFPSYRDSELWHSKGTGQITVTMTDGDVYQTGGNNNVNSSRYDLKYKGLTNGDRPTYYTWGKDLLRVGDKVTFKVGNIGGSFVAKKRHNGSIGYDWNDGTVVKNSEVSGRGVGVLTPKGSGKHSGWIEW